MVGIIANASDKKPAIKRAIEQYQVRRQDELQKNMLPEGQIRLDMARKRARWKAYQSRIVPPLMW